MLFLLFVLSFDPFVAPILFSTPSRIKSPHFISLLRNSFLCYSIPLPSCSTLFRCSSWLTLLFLCSDLRFLSVAFRFVGSLYHAIAQLYCSAPFHGFSLSSLSYLFLCFSAHDGASLFHSPSTQRFSLPSLIMPARCCSPASPIYSVLFLGISIQSSAFCCLSLPFLRSSTPRFSLAWPSQLCHCG